MNKSHYLQSHWRFHSIGALFFLMGVAVFVQLVRIQLSPQADVFRKQGDLYAGTWRTVYPPRGQIYDRWGNLLAGNKIVYQIGVELNHVTDPEGIAFAMMAVLDEDYENMLAIASQEPSPTAVFAVLTDFVPPEKVLQLQQLAQQVGQPDDANPSIRSLEGLVYIPHLQRSYPERDLAANVLGFVSMEGRGYFGVEEKYNQLLAGAPEEVWVPQDPYQVATITDIPPGASLILTIDREIQSMVEEILDQAVEENGAEAGTIAIMDPNNGEILAMATTPRLDLNEYWKYSQIIEGSTPFNPAVSKAYEPGSVFKIFTMAAALDAGAVEPDTPFLDTGQIEIGGAIIRNWNGGAWGPQDMVTCLQYSLNVCLAWVAQQLGPKDFYAYMLDFGFGHTTGVDIAGEVTGRLKTPGDPDWYPADLGTNSFGQGVSVTPTQMLMAASALANEGRMMTPHILRALVDNGTQYETPPQLSKVVLSAETARTITLMLARSLENEASAALVPGYRLAGKTGTAEIPTPYGYTSSATNASFVGWGPVDDPQFIVYVWFEKPTSSPWGSEVAAPVFRDVVERLVMYLNIPPDNPQSASLGR